MLSYHFSASLRELKEGEMVPPEDELTQNQTYCSDSGSLYLIKDALKDLLVLGISGGGWSGGLEGVLGIIFS